MFQDTSTELKIIASITEEFNIIKPISTTFINGKTHPIVWVCIKEGSTDNRETISAMQS